jgi:opacity protein-like surface antigen
MNRRIPHVLSALAIVVLLPVMASAQTGLGVRAGSIAVSGDYIEMDPTTAFGAHLAIGFIPVLKVQVGAEYLKGTATYSYDVLDVEEDYQAISLFADVRYPISVLPLFPIKPVVGGGLNLNLMSYLDEATYSGGVSTDPADYTNSGYHLMFGLLFDPPVLPFTITAEYRIQSIALEDDTVTNKGVVVGLTFGF